MLKFEFQKLLRGKAIWFCGLALLLIIGLSMFTLYSFQQKSTNNGSVNFGNNSGLIISVSEEDYSGKYFISSALYGQISLLLSILIPLVFASDFTYGIMKTVVARGYSRNSIIAARSITCLSSALILSFLSIGCAGIIGSAIWGFGGKADKLLFINLLTQLLIVCTIAYFYFSITVFIRKTGISLAVCVVSMKIIGAVFSLLSKIFNHTVFEELDLATMLSNISTVAPKSDKLFQYSLTCFVYLIIMFIIDLVYFRLHDVE